MRDARPGRLSLPVQLSGRERGPITDCGGDRIHASLQGSLSGPVLLLLRGGCLLIRPGVLAHVRYPSQFNVPCIHRKYFTEQGNPIQISRASSLFQERAEPDSRAADVPASFAAALSQGEHLFDVGSPEIIEVPAPQGRLEGDKDQPELHSKPPWGNWKTAAGRILHTISYSTL